MWKSRLVFILSTLLAVLLILLQHTQTVGYVILYSLILLFLLSLGSILVAPKALEIIENTDKTELEKNEILHYTSQIRNKSPLLYYCREHSYSSTSHFRGFGPATAGVISPRKGARESYSLSFPYRGNYPIGFKTIRVSDFLGLFSITLHSRKKLSVLVYPKADTRFAEHTVGQMEAGSTPHHYMEDFTTISDIRQHIPGESLKKAHWPLTAKWGELMMKNFEPISGSNVILFLDTKKVPLEGDSCLAFEDSMVSFVASAVTYHLMEDTPAQFIYGVIPLEKVTIDSLAEEKTLYRVLAEAEFKHPETLIPHYYNAVSTDTKPLFIYFFLFAISPDTISGLAKFLAAGHNILLYYFYSTQLPLTDSQRHLLEQQRELGIVVYLIEVGSHDEA